MSAGGQSCCWGLVQLPRGSSGFPLPETVQLCHGKGKLCLFWVTAASQCDIPSAMPSCGRGRVGQGMAYPWTGQQGCCGFGVWGLSEFLAAGSCLELPRLCDMLLEQEQPPHHPGSVLGGGGLCLAFTILVTAQSQASHASFHPFHHRYGLCGIHYIDAGYLGFKAYFVAPRKGTVWVRASAGPFCPRGQVSTSWGPGLWGG